MIAFQADPRLLSFKLQIKTTKSNYKRNASAYHNLEYRSHMIPYRWNGFFAEIFAIWASHPILTSNNTLHLIRVPITIIWMYIYYQITLCKCQLVNRCRFHSVRTKQMQFIFKSQSIQNHGWFPLFSPPLQKRWSFFMYTYHRKIHSSYIPISIAKQLQSSWCAYEFKTIEGRFW